MSSLVDGGVLIQRSGPGGPRRQGAIGWGPSGRGVLWGKGGPGELMPWVIQENPMLKASELSSSLSSATTRRVVVGGSLVFISTWLVVGGRVGFLPLWGGTWC